MSRPRSLGSPRHSTDLLLIIDDLAFAAVSALVGGEETLLVHPMLTLVLGGARSGKSRYAEGLIQALPPPWIYVATAEAYDDEMRARIAEHRARRPEGWATLDAPLAVPEAIRNAPAGAPVLVDCLTLWLTNLMLGEHDISAAMIELEAACAAATGPVVLVSNEVGFGIVPENALARRFRDAAGTLHQRLATAADRVVLTVAGLPLTVKGGGGAAVGPPVPAPAAVITADESEISTEPRQG